MAEQRKSPLAIILEIEGSLRPPLPEPPADASWVGKATQDLTPQEAMDRWNHTVQIQQIIASYANLKPGPDHPRYAEYLQAKRAYESCFTLSTLDLLREFDV